jgi:hypothetical protein
MFNRCARGSSDFALLSVEYWIRTGEDTGEVQKRGKFVRERAGSLTEDLSILDDIFGNKQGYLRPLMVYIAALALDNKR